MAGTRTPEGKKGIEVAVGLGLVALALAGCGYIGRQEVVGSGDSPDGSAPDGNGPRLTETLSAADSTRAAAEANGFIYPAGGEPGWSPEISPELAQVAELSLIDPQAADPAETGVYYEQIIDRLKKVGIRGDFQIIVLDLNLSNGARGTVPLVFNSATGESFAVFGSDENGATVPLNMGVGYYVWEMGRGAAADGTIVVGLMLPPVAGESKQPLAPIITVNDGDVSLQWPFRAVPKAPEKYSLIGIETGGKKALAGLVGLPPEEFSTATATPPFLETPIPKATATAAAADQFATEVAADKATQRAAPAPIPEWNPAAGRDLPPIHQQNAEFTPLDDGSAEIVFTDQNGQEFGLHIPRPEVIDGAGNPVEDGAIAAEFFRPAPARLEQTPPRIVLTDQNGEEMAWFDAETGEWTRRYETLFTLDSWPEFPEFSWFEDNLGFETYETFGPQSDTEFGLTVLGRVKRVYTEKVWYPAEHRFMELTWASVTYDKAGQKTLETILFTDTEFPSNPKPGIVQGVQIVRSADDEIGSYVPFSLSYKNRQILDAVENSAFVRMSFFFFKDSKRDGADFYAANPKLLFEYGYTAIIRNAILEGKYWNQQRGLVRAIAADSPDRYRSELKELDLRLAAQGYPPAESGVRIGFDDLWIFAPVGGD